MSKTKLDRLKALKVTENANLGDLLSAVLKVQPPKKKAAQKKRPKKNTKR